jgi:DNA polymerase family A/3'-5' exonuclease
MQLPLFQETHDIDAAALARCLRSAVVAVDVETETRWPGVGPRLDYGLSYSANVTVIGLAWLEGETIQTTALAAPFDERARDFLKALFEDKRPNPSPEPPLPTGFPSGTHFASSWRGGAKSEADYDENLFVGGISDRNNRLFVAHNAVFDARQLSKLTDGQIPRHIWDTQSMARLLHPAVDVSYSLLAVAATLGIAFPERQQAMKGQRSKLHTLPLELTLQYVQDDARLTLQIYQKQREISVVGYPSPPALGSESRFFHATSPPNPLSASREGERTQGYEGFANSNVKLVDPALIDWECRALHEYCRMAAQGIRLNKPFVEQRLEELGKQRDTLATRLRADGLLTPGSPQARAKYLYETKKIPLPKWSPKSWYFTRAGRKRLTAQPNARIELSDLSTRSDVIESYVEEGSPYAAPLKDLSAFLEVDWLISALKGLIDHAAEDGRLHSLVTIATESGRRASSYPHMQNWKMPAMAGVAIGDEGFTLVEIDYRNAENIMAALISGDTNLAAACAAEDFHTTMGERYFGKAWEQADAQERKRLRNMAKKITYGTAYGMGAERLGESIGVSTYEAQRVMRAKDAAFADVTREREAAKRQARDTQLLQLWTGRPVAVPTPFVAWNYLCQGGVSEVLKRAIVLLSEAYRERGMRSRVALDMHDALILEIAHEEWDDALALASEMMSSVTPPEMHERTKTDIRWVAQPDLAENGLKWGYGQLQP